MRRISLVLAVVVVVAMMVATASPAFAKHNRHHKKHRNDSWRPHYSQQCNWYWSYWHGWERWCWSPIYGMVQSLPPLPVVAELSDMSAW